MKLYFSKTKHFRTGIRNTMRLPKKKYSENLLKLRMLIISNLAFTKVSAIEVNLS